jgi:predicted DCC family thiol-disulfide oxidoreductase YuxK
VTGSVLVYDGDCGFCTAVARFAQRRIRTDARIVPWQRLDLAEIGLTRGQCLEAVQWIGADGRRGAGPVAIGYLLRTAAPGWRPVGWLLRLPPVRALAWPVYRWIARHRHQFPGGTPACAVSLTQRDGDRGEQSAL